jgi:ABC-type taurine transport system ATPase subunit
VANDDRRWSFEVRAWHVAVMLGAQFVVLGTAYGKIVQTQDDMRKDIVRIEDQRVITKDQFDDWKMEVIARMDRLEHKLDFYQGIK